MWPPDMLYSDVVAEFGSLLANNAIIGLTVAYLSLAILPALIWAIRRGAGID
jgi:hypothetical protein